MNKNKLESPIILQIETATKTCSIALTANGKLISLKESTDDFSHAESITLYIQKVLDQASIKANQLAAIAVSGGPGSYTGIRIGMSTAKGLCYSLGIPLIKLNSLHSLADGMIQLYPNDIKDMLVLPMIDARRMEVFMAVFNEQAINIKTTTAEVIKEDFLDNFKGKKLLLGGTGAKKVVEFLNNELVEYMDINHSAEWLSKQALRCFNEKNFEVLAETTAEYYKEYYLKK